jgi:DNA repair protein RadA/Sms
LELDAEGLVSVEDPSATMLAERGIALPGSVATVLAEGSRPLVVEIQALVTPAVASPARVAQGVSATRLRQLGAVLDAHCDLGIGRSDVFVACSGAVRATEPAVDVAVIAAMVSAFFGAALDARVVALGEVGLTGSVRSVLAATRRLEEAARVGLEVALVPPKTKAPAGIEVVEVATVSELVACVTRLSQGAR